MKLLLSNVKIQLAWRYFLHWFFWIALGAAATGGGIVGGGFVWVIVYIFADGPNAPYKDPVRDSAGPRERLMDVAYYLLGCVIAHLALFFLPGKPPSTNIWWFLIFIATAVTLNFTKPLPLTEKKAPQSSTGN